MPAALEGPAWAAAEPDLDVELGHQHALLAMSRSVQCSITVPTPLACCLL